MSRTTTEIKVLDMKLKTNNKIIVETTSIAE